MSWFRVDDSFPAHPKLELLGDGPEHAYATAAWTLMGADSSARGTDGHVSRARLGRVLPWPPRFLERAAADLVRVGLWLVVEGGWQFHDWTHYQPTKEQREKERAATRERQKAWKAKRRAGNAVTDAVTHGVSDASDNTAPSRPVPSRSPSEGKPAPLEVDSFARRMDANRVAFDRGFRSAGETPPPWVNGYGTKPWQELSRWLDAEHPNNQTIVAEAMGRGFAGNAYAKGRGFRERILLDGPSEFLPKDAAPTAVEPFDPRRDAPRTPAEEREQQAWIADGCPTELRRRSA